MYDSIGHCHRIYVFNAKRNISKTTKARFNSLLNRSICTIRFPRRIYKLNANLIYLRVLHMLDAPLETIIFTIHPLKYNTAIPLYIVLRKGSREKQAMNIGNGKKPDKEICLELMVEVHCEEEHATDLY